jgi:protein-L-isoaspartate(D-aspartate) O-methyltransferase
MQRPILTRLAGGFAIALALVPVASLFGQPLPQPLPKPQSPAYAFAQNLTAEQARNKMVDEEIVASGVKNPRVIAAMREVPRHEFVPLAQRKNSYYDMALPIGESQTISPPFIVAYMTESLDPQPTDNVLEIGTGSGYQAAVLSGLVKEVYTIEIVEPLGKRAAETLKRLKYDNVHVKVGDGYQGWPEHAPFDKIIVTCSPEQVPPALVKQLKDGGRMIIPVGQRYQQTMCLMKKSGDKMVSEALIATIFVPMTGKAEETRKVKPDPTHPAIQNGDFETLFGTPPQLAAWHYQRQVESVESKEAPSGKRYAHFHNADAGRNSQALQGFAVDGRVVQHLDFSVKYRCKNVKPGQTPFQLPAIVVMFYDENRGNAGMGVIGPWRGTDDEWASETKQIEVPSRAREAIVRIGMFGGVGDFSLDDLQMKGGK